MRHRTAALFLAVFVTGSVFGQVSPADLSVTSSDLWISQGIDAGYHLYIRKKPLIGSVMLLESTRDPAQSEDNYSYRAEEWNAVNGDEVRYLNGEPISRDLHIYSLVDSTPEEVAGIGEVFHIFIPYIVRWGYDTGRHGETYVGEGTYLNIRAFALPYADYRSAFADNPFILTVTQEPQPGPPQGNYMDATRDAFLDIAKDGGGEMRWSRGPEDLIPVIERILTPYAGRSVDVALCIDTTASMKSELEVLRVSLGDMVRRMKASIPALRVGLVPFRDYGDEYLTKNVPLSADTARIERELAVLKADGGRDIPEAVYEAIYEAATNMEWSAEKRIIILIGDAPPHPRPRGKITRELVSTLAAERGIEVHTIILPQ